MAQQLLQQGFRRDAFPGAAQQQIEGAGVLPGLPAYPHCIVHHDDGQYGADGKGKGFRPKAQQRGCRQSGHSGGMAAGHSAVTQQTVPVQAAVGQGLDHRFAQLGRQPGQHRRHQNVVTP